MSKKPTKTSLRNKADKIFADYWKAKIAHCEWCLRRNGVQLQLAHIVSRNCIKLRYSRDNAVILCSGCHFKAHSNPLMFYEFVEKLKGKGMIKYLIKSSHVLKPITIDYYQKVIHSLSLTDTP